MTMRFAFTATVVTLALAGCGRDEPETAESTAAPAAPATQQPATQPPPSSPVSAQDPAGSAPAGQAAPRGFGPRRPVNLIGVAACDQFLAIYHRCIAKAPEEARGGMKTALESWRGTWRSIAASPAALESLEQTCRSTADSTRSQLESYGCEL